MDYDVAIIGCGPSGLQAAIHAARKKVKVVVLGKAVNSALSKAKVENCFGIATAEGMELLDVGIGQAKHFGADIMAEDVMDLNREGEWFVMDTEKMNKVRSRIIILAPGISRVKLNVEGEKEYHGMGVSYCAACDCNFFKKKTVAVVGDGSMAAAGALLLREYASKVYWVARENKASDELNAKVKASDIEVLIPSWPAKILGTDVVTGLELQDGRKLDLNGVFIELGARGSADLAMDVGIMPDDKGFIKVDADCKTEQVNVLACGDVTGLPWQLAKAVGQGCVAGTMAAAMIRKENE
jgi:thioredoxin reductase (NADPH)